MDNPHQQQTQQEYTVEAIDDRLFRMERLAYECKRLAYECILNHPESKGFCTEIKHIAEELRIAIRHPHIPPAPLQTCKYIAGALRVVCDDSTCKFYPLHLHDAAIRNQTLDDLYKSFEVSPLVGNETEYELGFRQGMTHAQCTIKSLHTPTPKEQPR